jgi:CheY-like chemotaxis protein
MDQEILEHIFEPFFTTKEVGEGTGLGLATVYGIVKGHQGFIRCNSKLGQGTTFSVYFPVIEQDEAWVEKKDITIPPRGGGEIILVVDDEDFIRDMGEKIFTGYGYKVRTACDGEEALEIYRNERGRIDLVVLDLIMPGMGGGRCLEKLLEMDPQAKVLVASGYAVDGPTRKALESGTQAFVRKPYEVRELLKAVREALDES